MSWSAKWTWKPETPGSEPAGARISAGKSGNVERSLPRIAVSDVNWPPVSCMPSPESPAKRMTTESLCSTALDTQREGLAQTPSAERPAKTGVELGAPVAPPRGEETVGRRDSRSAGRLREGRRFLRRSPPAVSGSGRDEEADPEAPQPLRLPRQEQSRVVRAKRSVVGVLERRVVERVEVPAPGGEPPEERRMPEADVECSEATRGQTGKNASVRRGDRREAIVDPVNRVDDVL